jgi:hypothetical protein
LISEKAGMLNEIDISAVLSSCAGTYTGSRIINTTAENNLFILTMINIQSVLHAQNIVFYEI